MLRLFRASTLRNASRRAPILRLARHYSEPAFTPPSLTAPLSSTGHFISRFLKFSLVGCIFVAGTVVSAFEGTHLWVENVGLAPDTDPEVKRWEWDLEADKWSGGSGGGTDSGLGLGTQHTIRAAWMAQNWGTGSSVGVVTGSSIGARDTSAARIVDPQLEWAQNFLSIAITQTEKDLVKNPALSATFVELLIRHADILERINTRDSLLESRTRYERAWAGLGARGLAAARIASKLGDLNVRLGERDNAMAWWKRALELVQPESQASDAKTLQVVPPSLPSSPFAQRILASTLVSLSNYHASSAKDLKGALSVQQQALNLLRSLPPSESKSPSQALHTLFLSHRASLLSIQQAEVLFALRNPPARSIDVLSSAAQSSEGVISALSAPESGSSSKSSGNKQDSLLPSFADSRTLSKPAKSLLRDARRSAADAWNLIGVLSEPKDKAKALDCYERAIKAIGVRDTASGEYSVPRDGIPEGEWVSTKKNYDRLRRSVEPRS